MKIILLALLLSTPFYCLSQSLGKERIERLNKSIVRILIEDKASGSGFVVTEDGWIATCFHVIEPAMVRDSLGKFIRFKSLYAEFKNGEKAQLSLARALVLKGIESDKAVAYDYMLLKLPENLTTEINVLKLGNWADINEGDVIYSAGYPLGIKDRIISKGLFSTKWVDTVNVNSISTGKLIDRYSRNVAWIDITLNRGNSGGPIIMLSESPEQDVVVGLSTFILNPYGNIAEKVSAYYRQRYEQKNGTLIDHDKQMEILFDAISENSIGVSGTVSIDYLSSILQRFR